MIAVDPDEVRDYSLLKDTGGTVFQLGVLDSLLRAFIDDKYYEVTNVPTKDGEEKETTVKLTDTQIHAKFVDFVRFGLRGWKNFKDRQGKEVEFAVEEIDVPGVGKRARVKDESLKRLTLGNILELGGQILAMSRVSSQEAKSFS